VQVGRSFPPVLSLMRGRGGEREIWEHPNCANVSYKQGSRGALGAGELSEQGRE